MKTETTFFTLFVIGIALFFTSIPGASLLLLFSGAILMLLYFPFGFYFFCDKKLRNQQIVLTILGSVFLSLAIQGVLFRMMDWPGAMNSIYPSLVSAPLLFLFSLYLNKKGKEQLRTYSRNMMIRTGLVTLLVLVVYLIPARTLLHQHHVNFSELKRLEYEAKINPENEKYSQALKAYQDSLLKVEEELDEK